MADDHCAVPPVVEEILVRREGKRSTPYKDDVGLWTCGIGCRLRPGESTTEPWSEEKIQSRFAAAVAENALILKHYVKVPLTDQQRWALLCFMHQFGPSKFLKSTLCQLLQKGQYRAAADQLLRWDHEGEKEVPSIEARRIEERDLFLSGTPA